jgi:peptidoglycan/LPS O-acetylase OafA/YrhL
MKIKWFSLIRILGLVTVLGYHFFVKSFPGGFIGVDFSLYFRDI